MIMNQTETSIKTIQFNNARGVLELRVGRNGLPQGSCNVMFCWTGSLLNPKASCPCTTSSNISKE